MMVVEVVLVESPCVLDAGEASTISVASTSVDVVGASTMSTRRQENCAVPAHSTSGNSPGAWSGAADRVVAQAVSALVLFFLVHQSVAHAEHAGEEVQHQLHGHAWEEKRKHDAEFHFEKKAIISDIGCEEGK